MFAALTEAVATWHEEHPERWVLLVSAGAWAVMLPDALAGGACAAPSFGADWRAWGLMVLAMMVPLTQESVRWTAERSFRKRQGRAMAGYLAGYLAPWLTLGLGVAWLLGQPWARDPVALAPSAFLVAAAWSATPLYRRLVNDAHRTLPLAPRGWRADRDCLRLGVRQGAPCVATCAPLMLGCALAGHALLAMVGGAAIGAAERWSWRERPWLAPLACASLAIWYATRG